MLSESILNHIVSVYYFSEAIERAAHSNSARLTVQSERLTVEMPNVLPKEEPNMTFTQLSPDDANAFMKSFEAAFDEDTIDIQDHFMQLSEIAAAAAAGK